jgi:hypothetical protein
LRGPPSQEEAMRRRKFITVLGAAAIARPMAARGQQVEHVRRTGVLMYGDEKDYDYKARLSGFMQSLAQSGWAENRNLLVDVRWTAANLDLVRRHAKELVALKPDVLVATSTPVTAAPDRSSVGRRRQRSAAQLCVGHPVVSFAGAKNRSGHRSSVLRW